jgi:enterochelin esterase family protein
MAAGEALALDQFWTIVAHEGTPLIEPIPTAPDQILVTFLWKAAEPIDQVVLISPLGNGWWWKHFSESKLLRLGQTDLYYRTYQVRSDARFLYQLAPNDPLIHPADVIDWPNRTATWQLDPLNPHTYAPDDGSSSWSIIELPQAPPQPWIIPRPDLPGGDLTTHSISHPLSLTAALRRLVLHTLHSDRNYP